MVGDIALPSIKDLLRVSPPLADLRCAELDDPQSLEAHIDLQTIRYTVPSSPPAPWTPLSPSASSCSSRSFALP
jgi:hypothetical protein